MSKKIVAIMHGIFRAVKFESFTVNETNNSMCKKRNVHSDRVEKVRNKINHFKVNHAISSLCHVCKIVTASFQYDICVSFKR